MASRERKRKSSALATRPRICTYYLHISLVFSSPAPFPRRDGSAKKGKVTAKQAKPFRADIFNRADIKSVCGTESRGGTAPRPFNELNNAPFYRDCHRQRDLARLRLPSLSLLSRGFPRPSSDLPLSQMILETITRRGNPKAAREHDRAARRGEAFNFLHLG